jgi:outer membrane protein
MNLRAAFFSALLSLFQVQSLAAQEPKSSTPRRITLEEAVHLALKHNHVVRIAAYKVEEKEHAKDIARSAYFPILRNDSSLLEVTDTQFIGIPAGSLGSLNGASLPARSVILNQGGRTFFTSGTSLTQPLTELLKIKPANDIAAAELNASRDRAHQTENAVALRVHQIYYRILISQAHREATRARIKASDDLKSERVAQVKFGSVLEEEAIESRAQSLEARPPRHGVAARGPDHAT